MGKLSSELCKNENNTDISLYLPELHDDIFKYYRLNLLKKKRKKSSLASTAASRRLSDNLSI